MKLEVFFVRKPIFRYLNNLPHQCRKESSATKIEVMDSFYTNGTLVSYFISVVVKKKMFVFPKCCFPNPSCSLVSIQSFGYWILSSYMNLTS